MNLFTPGRAILEEVAKAASEDIAITIGKQSFTVPARIGEKLFKVAQGNVPVNMMARRFIVFTDDIPAFPAKGDTITWKNRTYKLGHPDGGPVWRWHGNECKSIAIYAIDFGAVRNEQPDNTSHDGGNGSGPAS